MIEKIKALWRNKLKLWVIKKYAFLKQMQIFDTYVDSSIAMPLK